MDITVGPKSLHNCCSSVSFNKFPCNICFESFWLSPFNQRLNPEPELDSEIEAGRSPDFCRQRIKQLSFCYRPIEVFTDKEFDTCGT